MVGDVNLFFNEPDDAGLAEVEVMIAGMVASSYIVGQGHHFTESPLIQEL